MLHNDSAANILTFALKLGTGVLKGFKITRTAVMSVKAQKLLKRLPLKFQYETFGAIANFRNVFWTEGSPEVDRK